MTYYQWREALKASPATAEFLAPAIVWHSCSSASLEPYIAWRHECLTSVAGRRSLHASHAVAKSGVASMVSTTVSLGGMVHRGLDVVHHFMGAPGREALCGAVVACVFWC